MADKTRGSTCQELGPVDICDGTSTRWRMPEPGITRGPEDVSYEIGMSYVPVETSPRFDPAEVQVISALRAHRSAIAAAERRFGIDRRAIGGAIAWELLQNVKPWGGNTFRSLAPSGGLAKVHSWNPPSKDLKKLLEWRPFETLASEVEERGYLPKRTFAERQELLRTPEGAITYVGAIMKAIAAVTQAEGFGDIRADPIMLTQVYHGETLASWEKKLRAKRKGEQLKPGNKMPLWLQKNLDLIVEGVGQPEAVCAPDWKPWAGSSATPPKSSTAPTESSITPDESFTPDDSSLTEAPRKVLP